MNKQCIQKPTVFTTLLIGLVTTLNGCSSGTTNTSPDEVNAVTLGAKIFFDTNLSSGANQSCASCHSPSSGFADAGALKTEPVSEGSVSGSFGNRNAPTSAYASFSPPFRLTTTTQTSEEASKYEGGQFLDGRSSDLIEQAKAPFLNPVEMNNTDAAEVVNKVMNSPYADDVRVVFGATVFDSIDTAYTSIATAIAAFENSAVMNPFTSKFDAYQNDPVANPLSASELRGFNLFKGSVAKCANCHTISSTTTQPSLFTNFKYYNVGTPANPNNPNNSQDLGLGAIIPDTDQDGKFKVPTLRNIELTSPYMHNGVYETLEEVVTHYDIQVTNEFITPEVNRNIAPELNPGTYTSLGLSTQDTNDLVAFMKTLTDGYF